MLAAPAPAETWSCSYIEKDRRVENIIFVRKGDSFRQVGQYKGRIEKIHVETDDVIHLYRFMDMVFDKSAKVVTVLDKKHEAFMQVTASTTTLEALLQKKPLHNPPTHYLTVFISIRPFSLPIKTVV
tara:strand:+ start:369 stop:749 length:381 start_codon:yes stop_codon:yes gene_type:complete